MLPGIHFRVFYYHLFKVSVISSFILGIEKLRFKPAYNPYTEPSMEIFSYHEGKICKYVASLFT